jgi:DNA-binding CsgD family transcriptional regulator/tetratricopeptide (TPR) repeat protein
LWQGTIADMGRRVTSPTMVGREPELARLREAFQLAAHGDRALVIVTGEAGVGKSRLITEFSREIAGTAIVVSGGGVELAAGGIPHGPFVRALGGIRPVLEEDLRVWLASPLRAPLRRLVPALADAVGDSGPVSAMPQVGEGDDLGALYEACLELLTLLSERQPLVLTLEDLHWADRSTLDLLRYLCHSITDGKLMFVVTARTDEPGRRLDPIFAELGREIGADWIELGRLDPASVGAAAEGILGRRVDTAERERLCTRSRGNPFFLEEIIAAGPNGGLSPTVRQLALARVATLSERAQAITRSIAVGGASLAVAQLLATTDLEEEALVGALKEAIDASVLVQDPDGNAYGFRHALISEAVLAATTSLQRERLHLAHARHLTALLDRDPTLAPRVAHHWDQAGDAARAASAFVLAAERAETTGAYPEALNAVQRALELLPLARERGETELPDELDLRRRGALVAYYAGEPSVSIGMLEPAIRASDNDEVDPERRAEMLVEAARYRRASLDYDGASRDVERAAHLLRTSPPSRIKAAVLRSRASSLAILMQPDEARSDAREALRIAGMIGDRREAALAMGVLGWRELYGHSGECHPLLRRSLEILLELGEAHEASFAYAYILADLTGQWDVALRVARDAQSFVEGESASVLQVCPYLAQIALDAGDWHLAMRAMETARRRKPTPFLESEILVSGIRIAVARGDAEEAEQSLERLRDTHPYTQPRRAGLEASLRLLRGDWAGVRKLVTPLVVDPAPDDMANTLHWLMLPGLQAEARLAEQARERKDGAAFEQCVGFAKRIVATVASRATRDPDSALMHMFLATAKAELSRVEGRSDPGLWRLALAAAGETGVDYQRAYPRIRLAEAILSSRTSMKAKRDWERAEARDLLEASYRTLEPLGAKPLLEEARAVAGRAGFELGPRPVESPAERQASATAAKLGLTARELEVLRLVAKGATNRQIGQTLFIAERTAAVHLDHLRMKLNVSNRVEAAAVAHGLGLV